MARRKKQSYDSAIIELHKHRQHDYFNMIVGEKRVFHQTYSREAHQYISTKARSYGAKKNPPQKFSVKKSADNAIEVVRVV